MVQIEGMDTNGRGKACHDLCMKHLKDTSFPERIAWTRARAAREPAADFERVGFSGGRAVLQNAMRAMLDHAGFSRVAVSDCGCCGLDNHINKLW